jgi:hypothetical protein
MARRLIPQTSKILSIKEETKVLVAAAEVVLSWGIVSRLNAS